MTVERLRATLLAGAEEEAQAVLAEADRRAAAEADRGQIESERLQDDARSEGEAAGELQSGRALALARAGARRLVLEAEEAVYQDFRRESLAAALALRDGREAYDRLLERLASEARRTLGDDAELELDPADVGGVRARAGRRSVDLTLPVLVDRCIADLGVGVEELWR